MLLSPEKYLKTHLRNLPIYKCIINENWKDIGMAEILVSRRHSTGSITSGIYLVDTYACGLKNTFFTFNLPEYQFLELVEKIGETGKPIEIDYVLAHNIIYGAFAFAEEFGMYPHEDFELTSHILEEDTEDIELVDIPFGVEGEPLFMEELTDGKEEGESFIEEEDFYSWTEDDWKIFLSREEIIKTGLEDPMIIDALYLNLLSKKFPGMPDPGTFVNLKDYPFTYNVLNLHNLSQEEMDTLQQIHGRLNSEDGIDFRNLEEEIQKQITANPANPVYFDYLAIISQKKGFDKDYKKQVMEIYESFPGYLFAKLRMGSILLDENRKDDLLKLFGGTTDLKKIVPDRTVFHVSELVYFASLMVRYHLQSKDHFMARDWWILLLEIDLDWGPESTVFENDMVQIVEVGYENFKLNFIADNLKLLSE